jgi:hypothetical protein
VVETPKDRPAMVSKKRMKAMANPEIDQCQEG